MSRARQYIGGPLANELVYNEPLSPQIVNRSLGKVLASVPLPEMATKIGYPMRTDDINTIQLTMRPAVILPERVQRV